MMYILESGLASFEGESMGEKTFVFPATRKEVERALKEALEDLAKKALIIASLEDDTDTQYQVIETLREQLSDLKNKLNADG